MKNIPKTWIKVNEDEEWIHYEAPISVRLSAMLLATCSRAFLEAGDFSGNYGALRYTYHDNKFFREHKVRNPKYVAPDQYVLIYGLDHPLCGAFCKFPPGLPWHKTVLPALQKVAREHGKTLVGGGKESTRAYVEGADEKLFNTIKNPAFLRYKWDGATLKSFKKS